MTITSRVNVQLINTPATDGRALDGLLYEPADSNPVASVLHLHGKGGNCYSGTSRFIPTLSAGTSIRHLALNMRCHDLGYTRPDVRYLDFDEGSAVADGGSWEQLAVGPLDVAAGVAALRACGPEPIYIAGHSSGGFYTATYCARDSDIAGRILLSPLTSNRRPLPMWFGGEEGLRDALCRAREMADAGEGHLLIPLPAWYYAISATSLLERASEGDDAWLTAMQASQAPVLFLWGGAESRDQLWHSLFDQLSVPAKQKAIIDGADHNFVGREEAVTSAVVEFVTEFKATAQAAP